MQTFNDTKKIIELTLLWEITKVLSSSASPQELADSLNNVFQIFLGANYLKIWIYDESTANIRDFSKNWSILDKKEEKQNLLNLYSILTEAQGQGFLINEKFISFDQGEKEFLKQINKLEHTAKATIILPIIDTENVIGLVEIASHEFDENFYSIGFFMCINIASAQISTAIVNMKLKEQMQLSINFHRAMKNIAKIIESQYELNYIIPLIGEMMDKFIPEHLIYIFFKEHNDKFRLLWPASYSSERINPLLHDAEDKGSYVISEDKSIGAFPLITGDKVLGAVIADGKTCKLTEKEIGYLDQLSHQAAITIEKANCYAEILQHATIDALTGLNNRMQFEIRFEQETSIAKRKNHPLCCMMIDVDYFKNINDTYGHMVGDKILHELSRIIREEIRTYDIASRYGGEEFCILLPDTKLDKAQVLAERLRKKVADTKFDISSFNIKKIQTLSATISIGISELKAEYSDSKSLLEQADLALYQAKREGRNKVTSFL